MNRTEFYNNVFSILIAIIAAFIIKIIISIPSVIINKEDFLTNSK